MTKHEKQDQVSMRDLDYVGRALDSELSRLEDLRKVFLNAKTVEGEKQAALMDQIRRLEQSLVESNAERARVEALAWESRCEAEETKRQVQLAREAAEQELFAARSSIDQLRVALLQKQSEVQLGASQGTFLESENKRLKAEAEKSQELLSIAYLEMKDLRERCELIKNELEFAEAKVQNKQAQAALLAHKAREAEAEMHRQVESMQAKMEKERTTFVQIARTLQETATNALETIPLREVLATFDRTIRQLQSPVLVSTIKSESARHELQSIAKELKERQGEIQCALLAAVSSIQAGTDKAALFESVCDGETKFFAHEAPTSNC